VSPDLEHALIILALVIAEAIRYYIARNGPSRPARRRKPKQAPLVQNEDQRGL
jgi:hypothetical protein